MAEFRSVGRVVRAHGIHGGLIVGPVTNQPQRFARGATVWVGDGERELTIAAATPYKGKLLVTFAEVDDRDAAEALRRRDLTIPADALGDPPEGEIWAHELEGLPVVDPEGTALGTVVAIEDNPAHDLLVCRTADGAEFLVPMVRELIDPLVAGATHVVLHPIPGLVPEPSEGGA